jgi:hypothetical protein
MYFIYRGILGKEILVPYYQNHQACELIIIIGHSNHSSLLMADHSHRDLIKKVKRIETTSN